MRHADRRSRVAALGRRTIRRRDRTRRSSPGAGRRRSISTLKNPPSRTTCATRSRSPSAACAWASTLMTQSLAASRAASISESAVSLPCVALGELAVRPERNLAGDEQKRPGAHGRNIVGDRRRGFRKNDAQLLQALGGFAHRGGTPRREAGLTLRRCSGAKDVAGQAGGNGLADRFSPMSPVRRRQACFCLGARLGLRSKSGCAGGLEAGRRGMG